MATKSIIIGLIFLINPEIMMLDILPDLIGYILIMVGMKKLARIDFDFKESKKYLKWLILISAVKIMFMPSVFGTNIQTNKLTVQFLFGIAELICGYLFSKDFLAGLDMTASRSFGDVLLSDWKEIKLVITLFFPVKIFLSMLPQFTVLFYSDIDADPNEVIDYLEIYQGYNFTKNILTVISAVLMLSFGIKAVRMLSDYRKKAISDFEFSNGIDDLYKEKYLDRGDVIYAEDLSSSFGYAFFATLFLGSVYVDNVSLLPRCIFFLLSYFALKKLSRFDKKAKAFLFMFSLSLIIFAVRTSFAFILNAAYQEKFVFTLAGFTLSAIDEIMTFIGALILFAELKKASVKNYGKAYPFVVNIVLTAIYSVFSFYNYQFNPEGFLYIAPMWLIYILIIIINKLSLDSVLSFILKNKEY